MLVFFDLDGTLADFDKSITEHIRKMLPPGAQFSRIESEMTPEITAMYENVKRLPGFWRNLEVIEDGDELFEFFKHCKARLHILTRASRRNPQCWAEKVEWVNEHYPDTPITITTKKEVTRGDVLVDDMPSYLEAWLKKNPTSKALMPDQPWNQDFTHERCMRVESMTSEQLQQVAEFLGLDDVWNPEVFYDGGF